MKPCREIKQYFEQGLSGPQRSELREHLRECPKCAKEFHLVRLQRRLLQATLPQEEAVELSPDFRLKLRAQRMAQPKGNGVFWELAWDFFKPFAAVTLALVALVGALNLHGMMSEPDHSAQVESYLGEPQADDVGLILSENVALTQDRVLRTLVVNKEEEYGHQR